MQIGETWGNIASIGPSKTKGFYDIFVSARSYNEKEEEACGGFVYNTYIHSWNGNKYIKHQKENVCSGSKWLKKIQGWGVPPRRVSEVRPPAWDSGKGFKSGDSIRRASIYKILPLPSFRQVFRYPQEGFPPCITHQQVSRLYGRRKRGRPWIMIPEK